MGFLGFFSITSGVTADNDVNLTKEEEEEKIVFGVPPGQILLVLMCPG
jgi:hypothetical protein